MSILIESAVCLSILPESEQGRFGRRMSGYTAEAQLRFVLEWFGEFSELQREDFLPVLAAARAGEKDLLAKQIAALSCTDKPISLFQCRIKLFNEWYPTWSDDERGRLVNGVSDMDPGFGKKLEDQLINGVKINGDVNGDNEIHTPEEVQDQNGHEEGTENNNHNTENEDVPEVVVTDNIPLEIAAAS